MEPVCEIENIVDSLNESCEIGKSDDPLNSSDFFGLKKKKKKKYPFASQDPINMLDESEKNRDLEELSSVLNNSCQSGDTGVLDTLNVDDDLNFNLSKKKKKKVSFGAVTSAANILPDFKIEDSIANVHALTKCAGSWIEADGDYTYEELLLYLFHSISEKNPDIVVGEKKKIILKPPQILRVGTKKTSFANFYDTCKSIHRQPKHVQSYLLAELGTSGSIDANCQLIIKGRFQQKQIENVLRHYIKEYVTCHTCHSPDTILQKDTRLFFLQCETCGARCSVTNIKTGFQAVTGKRAALRAKIN